MAIDVELRATGIGGSEIAALLGLDANRDAFSIYADKLGLLERAKPNARMRWGSLLEKAIADGYSEETGFTTIWSNVTQSRSDRPWHVYTIDAFVAEKPDCNPYDGLLDCKNVDFGRAFLWGERGSDDVPIHIALQMHWYCSGADMPWADIAALFGGNDLRIFRVHRDPAIEAIILEEAEKFWRTHVLARVPPPIGASHAAREYLKQRYPKAVEELRVATDDECALITALHQQGEEWDRVNRAYDAIANQVKLAIGDAQGLLDGKRKVTWRRSKDSVGVDWEAAARDAIDQLATMSQETDWQDAGGEPRMTTDARKVALATRYVSLLRAFTTKHTRVLKQGSRRLLTNFSKLKPEDR